MKAIAKTNLFLEIIGRRDDGYHDLINVFCPVHALADDVSLLPDDRQGFHVQTEGNDNCPADDSNLCMKAAAAFAEATGIPPRATIRLVKHIPVAAGLGGGSSDAAATLRLLNDNAGTPLSDSNLRSIASRLGADVPFFLNPGFALGKGIGDILTPCPVAMHFALVILNPGFPLPVAWSFNHAIKPDDASPSFSQFQEAAAGTDIQAFANATRNDLEHAVFGKFPILTMIRQAFLDAGALAVHVSGSGPSLFAIAEPARAQGLAERIHLLFPQFSAPVIQMF